MHANRNRSSFFCAFIVSGFLALAQFAGGQSQSPNPSRISDKDLETLIGNLKDDAKSFRPRFDSAIQKSTIRKTSQAKDAKNLASLFQNQTAALLKDFKRTKKGTAFPNVLSSASQIEKLIHDLNLDAPSLGWDKVRADLAQVSNAFGVAMPSAADSGQSNSVPCLQAAGAERTKKLVDQCMLVSPATHPPCNGQNSCTLIVDEIHRGCGLLQQNIPTFCAEYR
jgi:hypothetical protein